MDFIYAEMGKRIKNRRKTLGIKQNELAERIGISNNHLSSIERGLSNPSLNVFVDICNQLQVTPDYLLMGMMHSGNVPQRICDGLRLCTKEDVELVDMIVQHMVKRNEGNWNDENFV